MGEHDDDTDQEHTDETGEHEPAALISMDNQQCTVHGRAGDGQDNVNRVYRPNLTTRRAQPEQPAPFSEVLDGSATGDQVVEQNCQSHDQQQVYQAASAGNGETQQPQYQDDQKDGPQNSHCDLTPSNAANRPK